MLPGITVLGMALPAAHAVVLKLWIFSSRCSWSFVLLEIDQQHSTRMMEWVVCYYPEFVQPQVSWKELRAALVVFLILEDALHWAKSCPSVLLLMIQRHPACATASTRGTHLEEHPGGSCLVLLSLPGCHLPCASTSQHSGQLSIVLHLCCFY